MPEGQREVPLLAMFKQKLDIKMGLLWLGFMLGLDLKANPFFNYELIML